MPDWIPRWVSDRPEVLIEVIITAIVFYGLTLFASKMAGIRSFTQASGFDFLVTLSMGALLATTIIKKNVSILEGTLGLVSLYSLQLLVAYARRKWSFVNRYVDNQPILLMENGSYLPANMKKARITHLEVQSKLRSHNISRYDQIRAVVLEPSGGVSVIKHDPENPFDTRLLEGVRK
jgi:uncharacterized membrane protein YcaP (DUF421 family)